VDDEASLAQVSLEDFWEALGRTVGLSDAPAKNYPILFSWDEKKAERLSKFVADQVGSPQRASVKWTGSQFIRQREQAGFTLHRESLKDAVLQALENGGSAELPIVEAPKSVPDAALESIDEVRTSFTTKFSTAKVTRCANIKLAASKIDGYVLMPGERFSFNQTVGRRTQSGGFKVAGVYRNGRHDFDIGGGICQVSTTLYNAALLSNLKIVARGNHSMPVPYVPLGRDATVDYGAQDLVFENSLDHPIALSSHYGPGRITFHILGKKDPGLEVKIVTSGHRSWDKGVKYEHDPNLAYGVTKVTEKGSAGHSVQVARLVYRDGKLVSRESLGQSYYRGGVKIIAKNMKASPPAAGPAASPPDSAEPTDQ
jgi:vancomycin resistance protein YoaR